MLTVDSSHSGAVLVYDITIKESFDKVAYWLEQLRKNAPRDIVIFIVGNKIDKENERKISKDQLMSFCKQQKVFYEETSAKEDLGVAQMFRNLTLGRPYSSQKSLKRTEELLMLEKATKKISKISGQLLTQRL